MPSGARRKRKLPLCSGAQRKCGGRAIKGRFLAHHLSAIRLRSSRWRNHRRARAAVRCNQRGHSTGDCDPSCTLYAPTCSERGPDPSTYCNDLGHGWPMIAIPRADDCGSPQLRKSNG